jgi:hypothetical protein
MAALNATQLFWAFSSVHFIGLLSAALARLAENRSGQAQFQALFFGALAVVALTTVASMGLGWEAWMVSGGTLSMMVVMAIWDPGTSAVAQ